VIFIAGFFLNTRHTGYFVRRKTTRIGLFQHTEKIRAKEELVSNIRWWLALPRCRLYASAMAADDTTPRTNPTSSTAPKSHSATNTTGTGSSKNLPYASPMMVPANARARGRWGAPEGWVRRGLQLVLLLWAVDFLRRRRGAVLNMATRSPPSYSHRLLRQERYVTCERLS
jgi:hypothetical protein